MARWRALSSESAVAGVAIVTPWFGGGAKLRPGRPPDIGRTSPSWGAGSGRRGRRIGAHEDGVEHRGDLVGRHAHAGGVVADRLRAGGLVDSDGSERAALVHDVAADPADVRGHLLVADAGGDGRGGLEVGAGLPAVAAADRV